MTSDVSEEFYLSNYDADPQITPEQIENFENMWRDLDDVRVIAMTMLTKSFEDVRTMVIEDKDFAEAVAALYRSTNSTALYERAVEYLKIANAWSLMALCARNDCAELIEVAESVPVKS